MGSSAQARPFAAGGAGAYALRRLRRGWRSGELLILALAMVVAVAAMSAVSLFFSSMREAIARQTGETLGADLVLRSRNPIPAETLAAVEAAGVRHLPAVVFASVILNGEATALASVKAVGPGFPLRGRLRVADEPFGPARESHAIPGPGEAWVDLRLWQELGLEAGAQVQAGALRLRVTALLVEEPGRGFSFTDLAPRMLMNESDLAATQLLGPGARAQYQLLLAGEAGALERARAVPLPGNIKRESPQEAQPELMESVQRSYDFLVIARLAATLLAAAAIALCAWQWGHKLRDEVALLKCLGARTGYVLREFTLMLLLLGLAATAAGATVGYAAQQVLALMLEGVMQVALPPPELFDPLRRAVMLTLILLFGFALPPVLGACATPPTRVFQRDPSSASRRLPMAAAAAAVAATLWLQIGQWLPAVIVLGGVAAVALVLGALALLLVRALAPLKRAVGTSWRFGLGNVARRQWATVAQTVALGQALLALLLVTIVQQDLLASWRAKLPEDAPNQFLINVQTAQIEPLRGFFAARGLPAPELWPMARGRLTHLRGVPLRAEDYPDDRRMQWWINRDVNLSWADRLNEDNEVVAGAWWGADAAGQPLLSVEDSVVDALGVALGDTLTLDFAGTSIEFTVHNVRRTDWGSLRPNFFLLAPPGVLDEGAAAQWLSSFHLAPEQRALLPELIRAFPNVTVLDIEALMAQVRSIMDRVVRAVEFVFLFTLAAGLTVLLAAIEATRGERVRETGLLRTLGARGSVIARGLVAEYAVLGLLAGTVAAVAAQVIAWLLAEQLFMIPYGLRPALWLAGAGAGAALVTALGWISLRGTLRTPPHTVLRGSV
jgi:putative ABC transport system permease protein